MTFNPQGLLLSGFLRSFLRIFIEGNIHKQKSNYQKCRSYLRSIKNMYNIHLSKISSIFTDINNEIIPDSRYLIKMTIPLRDVVSVNAGTINTAPNQPAARLVNNSESTLNQALVKIIPIHWSRPI
mgnify:CR=1 FL=1